MRTATKIWMPLAAAAVIGSVVYGTTTVNAASDGSDQRATLIQKLADKLGVDKAKVQAVFDEDRTAREADRQKSYEDRLNQAVKDGKLTEEQKTKVLAKHHELEAKMQAARDTFRDKTEAERHTAMEATRTEIEQWAKDTGIDAKWLMGGGPGMGKGGMMGGHGGRGHGMMGDRDGNQIN
jgi:hypothetical protein